MLGWIGDIERLTEENTTFRTGYSLYAPPQHADGTVHVTKRDAELAEATAG